MGVHGHGLVGLESKELGWLTLTNARSLVVAMAPGKGRGDAYGIQAVLPLLYSLTLPNHSDRSSGGLPYPGLESISTGSTTGV